MSLLTALGFTFDPLTQYIYISGFQVLILCLCLGMNVSNSEEQHYSKSGIYGNPTLVEKITNMQYLFCRIRLQEPTQTYHK